VNDLRSIPVLPPNVTPTTEFDEAHAPDDELSITPTDTRSLIFDGDDDDLDP
jgi:hypothetical protein